MKYSRPHVSANRMRKGYARKIRFSGGKQKKRKSASRPTSAISCSILLSVLACCIIVGIYSMFTHTNNDNGIMHVESSYPESESFKNMELSDDRILSLAQKAFGFHEFDYDSKNIFYCFIDPHCKNCEETKVFFRSNEYTLRKYNINIFWIPVSILTNDQTTAANMLDKNMHIDSRLEAIDINTAILLHSITPPSVPYIIWNGANGPGVMLGTPDDKTFKTALEDMTGKENA